MSKHEDKFAAKLAKYKDTFEQGLVLYIDPASGASSPLGWALSDKGQLIASGTVGTGQQNNTPTRLAKLATLLSESFLDPKPDLVIIEEIRGRMAHHVLTWAVGVIMVIFCDSPILEMPITLWKKHRWDDYEKTDENDAKCMFLATKSILETTDG